MPAPVSSNLASTAITAEQRAREYLANSQWRKARDELKPLAELQYRGVFWSQVNGKDWTVTAFLQTNHGGLQLKLARDAVTSTSIRRSLVQRLRARDWRMRHAEIARERIAAPIVIVSPWPPHVPIIPSDEASLAGRERVAGRPAAVAA